jgi:hypothetical protein
MKNYQDLSLEYKNSFKNTFDLVKETNNFFKKKYFYPDSKGDSNFSRPFIPGQIYSFYYPTDSEIKEKRKFINRNPIVICINNFTNKEEPILRGIDLITMPPKYRIPVLSKIYDNFYNTLKENQKKYENKGVLTKLPLEESSLERLLSNSGYKKSLFGFKFKFIRNTKPLSLEDWFKLPYLGESLIEGIKPQEIYSEYESKLI